MNMITTPCYLIHKLCPHSQLNTYSRDSTYGEVTPLSSGTPLARQINIFFLSCNIKVDHTFINKNSWVYIHDICYILKIHNKIWWFVFLIARMMPIWTKTITIKNDYGSKYQKIHIRCYQWLCTCKEIIKLTIIYAI